MSDVTTPDNKLLADLTVSQIMAGFANSQPTPGGGSAAALAGAMSSSLTAMVGRLTAKKKGFEAVTEAMYALAVQADALTIDFTTQIDKDAEAYDRVTAAFKLPSQNDEDKLIRRRSIQAAMKQAANTPMHVAKQASAALGLALTALRDGNPNTSTDAAVAVLLAATALEGASLNIAINLDSIKDQAYVAEGTAAVADLLAESAQARTEMWDIIGARIKTLH
jgi:methenyltetrahydrofolate cyclohydrolase